MITQSVQFSHIDGICVVDDLHRNPSISQPSMQSHQLWILNELPRNLPISQPSMQLHESWVLDEWPRNQSIPQTLVQFPESWVVDELPINPSTSQSNSTELWISEQIGRLHNSDFVQRSREQLIDLELEIKTKVFDNDNVMDPEVCSICQTEYEGIERVSMLLCGHEYHSDCIKRWLMLKNVCPLCKRTAINCL